MIIVLAFVIIIFVGIILVLSNDNLNSIENINNDNINIAININKVIECASDDDCEPGGCSGQLCLSKSRSSNIITTCEWRDEYACFQVDNCLCINNECQWERNFDYFECINNI